MENPFEYLICCLERKKPKLGRPCKSEESFVSKPIYEQEQLKENLFGLHIDYNYYHVYITYAEDKVWNPYEISIEKPCVICKDGGQYLGTSFYENEWADEESVWLDLQQHWKKTIQ